MNAPGVPGFIGKVPTHGDFVTRRLSVEFKHGWDQWLEAGITVSREQLGGNWPGVFMNGPLWRFALSPGLCGRSAWAGVMLPSVDRVGRYFPLTLAAPVADSFGLMELFGGQAGRDWFADLERLALSSREPGFNLEEFDQRLLARPLPEAAPGTVGIQPAAGRPAGKFAQHVGLASLDQTAEGLSKASAVLLNRLLPLHSLWCTGGVGPVAPALLLVEGLPPSDAFMALLTGQWTQRGWAMASLPVNPPPKEPPPPAAPTVPQIPPNTDLPTMPIGMSIEHFFDDAPTLPRAGPALLWRWRSWGACVPGLQRKLNEDAMVRRDDARLWAVADGMGGHHAGDVASATVQRGLEAVDPAKHLAEFAEQVEAALQDANRQLCQLAAGSGIADQIIGSTVVALLAVGNTYVFLWAGDSRLYRFRAGKLEQLTQDHSLFQDFARQGVLTAEQIAEAGRCNVITRAVGGDETLQLSRGGGEAVAGDLYLLCSDGLNKELTDEELEAVLREAEKDNIVPILIEQAEKRGGRDNITVVVIEFLTDAS